MVKFLLDYLRDESGHAIKPSAYWITYVYTMLAEHSHGAAVVAHMRPRWAPMIAYGSTFGIFGVSEAFAASHSHAWSAHPLFHLMQIVGGGRQTAPAWREISFAPTFIGDSGGATYPTPQGLIIGAWRREGSSIKVSLKLPCGISAAVGLPGRRSEKITGWREWSLPGGG